MDETLKITLLISLITNTLLVGLGIVFVFRKGGLPYLLNKITSLLGAKNKIILMSDNIYYLDKTSHFHALPNNNSAIIFLGDSLTDNCEWAEVFGDNRIKNRGISGDRTDGVLNRLDEIVANQPQKIFLLIGTNDLVQGVEESIIVNNYQLILNELKETLPETKVFVQSVLPINSKIARQKLNIKLKNEKIISLNAKLKELAKEFSFQYIDLFSCLSDSNNEFDARYTTDGIHLNGQAYLVWKEAIAKEVEN